MIDWVVLEANGQLSYIKPANYEMSKTRKYRNDIEKIENMEYHAESDIYICRNAKKLTADQIKHSKSKTGYVSKKQSINVRTAADAHIKAAVSKGITVKHL